MENNLLLYGAGGHAKVILGCLDSMGLKVEAVFDDNPHVIEFMGLPVHHFYKNAIHESLEIIISIGDNRNRENVSQIIKHKYFTIVHPTSVVSKFALLGAGTVVFQNSVVQPGVKIGRHCIINTGSIVEHDCELADYVHISPNATLSGTVKVGTGTQIGSGAVVIPNITIGKWSIIGAGSVVINNIPDYSVAVGNPAKIIKKIQNES